VLQRRKRRGQLPSPSSLGGTGVAEKKKVMTIVFIVAFFWVGVAEKKKVTGAIATIAFFYVVLERKRR